MIRREEPEGALAAAKENEMSTEKVGFIGLGIMGKSMASNLVRNGFDLTLYDLRKR